jgi:CBS domain-containing protein
MRVPLTGIVFSLELTHDVTMLLPLLIGAIVADGFTVLTLRRSILTEKVSRRGYHLSREYAVDPLEILFVREVMRTNVVAIPAGVSLDELERRVNLERHGRLQRLYPVVDEDRRRLLGVLTPGHVGRLLHGPEAQGPAAGLMEAVLADPVVAYPDEPLRVVAYRMAETGLTRFPVVSRDDERTLLGMLSLNDLLKGRSHNLEAERRRERVLRLRFGLRRREEAGAGELREEQPV